MLGKFIIGFTVLCSVANGSDEVKQKAQTAMQTLGSTLKGELKAKFKADPSGMEAITYCSDEAQLITKQVNDKLQEGVSVRRTALKYRNDANEPSIQDIEVMRGFQKQMAAGKKPDSMMKMVEDEKTIYVYKALGVGQPCLKCHGDVATMDKNIVEKIDNKFPYDRARNFVLGDFRGAIVAEIKK